MATGDRLTEVDAVIDAPPISEGTATLVKEYEQYLDFMPPHLKYDNFEILILYDEQDRQDVKEFQDLIKTKCFATVKGQPLYPVVKLEEECANTKGNPAMALDGAFEKALYVFLFVTQAFCGQGNEIHKGYSCLKSALNQEEDCVVLVLKEDNKTMKRKHYKLPMVLDSLKDKAIKFWDRDSCIEAVNRLLDSRMSVLFSKNKDLDEKREKYFRANEKKLKEYQNLLDRSQKMDRSLKYPDQVEGGGSKLGPAIMHTCHNDGELRMDYASSEYHSDLRSVPDTSDIETDVASIASHPQRQRPSSDSDLARYSENINSQSLEPQPSLSLLEQYFNFQGVNNALPLTNDEASSRSQVQQAQDSLQSDSQTMPGPSSPGNTDSDGSPALQDQRFSGGRAVQKGKLNSADYKKIRDKYKYLLEEIEAKNLTDFLFQEYTLSDDDIEEIWSLPTKTDRNRELLKKVRYSGPEGYCNFLQALEEAGYDEVVKKLEGPASAGAGVDQLCPVSRDDGADEAQQDEEETIPKNQV